MERPKIEQFLEATKIMESKDYINAESIARWGLEQEHKAQLMERAFEIRCKMDNDNCQDIIELATKCDYQDDCHKCLSEYAIS